MDIRGYLSYLSTLEFVLAGMMLDMNKRRTLGGVHNSTLKIGTLASSPPRTANKNALDLTPYWICKQLPPTECILFSNCLKLQVKRDYPPSLPITRLHSVLHNSRNHNQAPQSQNQTQNQIQIQSRDLFVLIKIKMQMLLSIYLSPRLSCYKH